MITRNILEAQIYSLKKHEHQTYDENPLVPYSVHLFFAVTFGLQYLYLLDKNKHEIAIMALWLHDVREDLGISYNEIKQKFGFDVAEIVYCLTNNDGRTREEKAVNTYGPKTSTNRLAVYGKLCDRLANVKYGTLKESSMLKKQKKEFAYMVEILFVPGEYDQMWVDLADLLEEPRPTSMHHGYTFRGPFFYQVQQQLIHEI